MKRNVKLNSTTNSTGVRGFLLCSRRRSGVEAYWWDGAIHLRRASERDQHLSGTLLEIVGIEWQDNAISVHQFSNLGALWCSSPSPWRLAKTDGGGRVMHELFTWTEEGGGAGIGKKTTNNRPMIQRVEF